MHRSPSQHEEIRILHQKKRVSKPRTLHAQKSQRQKKDRWSKNATIQKMTVVEFRRQLAAAVEIVTNTRSLYTEVNNLVRRKGKSLKTRHTGQQLTSTKLPRAGHTTKSEKGTTVSAEQLSLRRPAIKSEKGGKETHCVNC
jgi:hypothetical protein